MPIDITMPALSPTMETGTLAKWIVKVGDSVKSGDILCEIETDKATMEVESIDEGVVAELLVAEGAEEIPVGQVIARLSGEGEAAAPALAKAAPVVVASPPPAPPVPGGEQKVCLRLSFLLPSRNGRGRGWALWQARRASTRRRWRAAWRRHRASTSPRCAARGRTAASSAPI
jgi:pyruvate dehydrogenase E2 component (dihydrolipoamide acetyltransferase)